MFDHYSKSQFQKLKDANFIKKYATAKMDLEKFNDKNNFYLWREKDENSENIEVEETLKVKTKCVEKFQYSAWQHEDYDEDIHEIREKKLNLATFIPALTSLS